MARPDFDDASAGGSSDAPVGCVLYEECDYHRRERESIANHTEGSTT